MPLTIKQIGERKIKSPLIDKFNLNDMNFVKDEKRMLYNVMLVNQDASTIDSELTFELAGPRETLHFEPENVTSAIVTCGGLCPGLNDVIRSIVMESYYRYGAKKIYGIRYGYNGLNPAKGYAPLELTPDLVRDIHMNGGTMLGSSRGGTDNMNILMILLKNLKSIFFTPSEVTGP